MSPAFEEGVKVGFEEGRIVGFEEGVRAGRLAAFDEALQVLVDVAKQDYAQGEGVQNIVCDVLHSAMLRILKLKEAP